MRELRAATDYTVRHSQETIAHIGDAAIYLYWTDQSQGWQVNEGPEVLVVLDGVLALGTRHEVVETTTTLASGDVLHFGPGEEHLLTPLGVARVLVLEHRGRAPERRQPV